MLFDCSQFDSIKTITSIRKSPRISNELSMFLYAFMVSFNREGDISLLEVDVITNTSDETLTEKNSISSRVFKRAGSDLYNEIVHYHRGNQALSTINHFGFDSILLIVLFSPSRLLSACLTMYPKSGGCGCQTECRTGDVRVTKGHNLYARHIIHTVCPIYSDKYKTASEQTLHSCYR